MAHGKFASFAAALMLGASAFAAQVSAAEDTIGVTAAVNPQASGQAPAQQRRELRVGVNVVANERIVTTAQGQVQMLFRDESAFTIGPNSDVVLDEFVYDPNTQTGKIAFSATKGVFRLVGGKISKKTPVTLKTPTSTIGIRGGIALITIQPNGATRATFLFGDAMTVESGGVEKRVTRPGFSITTESADSPPSDPQPVTSEDLDAALSALEGGLEPAEEEDESGGETSQAANNTNEESDESEDDSGDDSGDDGEGGAEDGGGDSGEESETASDEGATDGDDGATDGDDGATDGDDGAGGDDSGGTDVAANDVPTDEDMASSDISALGSDSEPEALAPETDSTFEVALADTATSESIEEIADDTNITESTTTDTTTTDPEPDPEPAGFALSAKFSGRIKHGSSAAAGSDDATTSLNLGFSGATVSDGVFDTAAGTGRFTIDIDSTDGTATSTSNPFGTSTLSGTRVLRADQEFVTYELTDQTDSHRVLAFAGVPTTAYPTTGATFYELSGDFIMGSLFPFIPDASVGAATRGTSETNAAIMWDDSQSTTAQQAFGAVVMGKSGTNLESVVSIFIGEVKTSAGGEYLAGKVRGSTRVGGSNVLHTLSGAFDTARDANDASFFGGDQPDHFVLQATSGTTVTDVTSVGTVTFRPNAVADVASDTLGTRTTRTASTSTGMNGFAAGLVEKDVSGSLTTDFLVNNSSGPGDISIETSAETNKVKAEFSLRSVNGAVAYVYRFGDDDFGAFGDGSSTSGNSAFIDDEHFGAVDRAMISSWVGGTVAVGESLYMLSAEASGGSPSAGECDCQYLVWGYWGGQLNTANSVERVHLAFWVAGQMSDYTTITGVTGTATYAGHIAGTVNNGGSIYHAVGALSMTVDFSNPAASTTSITSFDGGGFSGTGLTFSAGGSGLAVFNNSANLTGSGDQAGRTASITGGFVSGGGDAAAELAGNFTVTGTGYEAAGIIAAAK